MPERVPVRKILNSTNAFFYRGFGQVVAPALVAGFLEYWANWGQSWLQHRAGFALMRQFRGNIPASMAAVVPLGILLRLLVWGVDIFLWGFVFAVIAEVVVESRRNGGVSSSRACRVVAGQPGWGSLLWRLYWRLALAGYLLMMAIGLVVWACTSMGVDFRSAEGKFLSEILGLVLGNFVFLLYSYRFALAIPLPVAAGDEPIDPIPASSFAGKRWRVAIIVSCMVVWGISNLADLHLPLVLMSPGLIRPTVLASYEVRILVALITSILWAWLFVFLTEIAIASVPDAIAAVHPGPVPEPAANC